MLVHGLVEDTIYGSQAVLFLYALPGLTVVASLPRDQDARSKAADQMDCRSHGAVLVIIGRNLVFYHPPVADLDLAGESGCGTHGTGRTGRLPMSRWDDSSNANRLDVSEPFFERSLAASATNRTTHHRLGLIAMQRRDFEEAVTTWS